MKSSLSLTRDSIPRLTWRIAMPMSVGMFFNTMFNVVDTYCAGYLGTDALAALSMSFPVFFMVFAVGSGLSQGTTALIANALGAGNRDDARRLFAQAFVLAIAAGIALSGLGLLVAPTLFRYLGAEGDYLKTVLAYMNVILAGGTFFLMPMILNTALSAQGETRWYRNYLIASFVANCALNPVLMLGLFGLPRMGVSGIALATVIVQIGGAIYLWRHAMGSDLCQGMERANFRPDLATTRRIAAQSVPAAMNMLTVALGIFVITWFVKHFGKEAVAAVGIATRIEQIVLMPAIGLNTAVLSIVGQNYGAGLYDRVRHAWWINVKTGAVLMIVGGAIMWLLRVPALRIFTKDPAVILHGSNYLTSSAVTLAAYPILFVTVFAMQGLKRPQYGLWVGLYRQICAPLVVYHFLTFGLGWGLWGIWWGISMVTWSAALFALWYGARALEALQSPTPEAVPVS